jgi:hypothetical protein
MKAINITLDLSHLENLLWILAEWGNYPATTKESVTPTQFNELVERLTAQRLQQ